MRFLVKTSLSLVCRLLVIPAVMLYRLQCLLGAHRAFAGWSQVFSLIPGLTGAFLRHAFLRSTIRRCGPDACISFGTLFSHPGVSIGRTVYIGNYCSIGDVTIEDDVLISSHVSVMNGCRQHGTERLDIPIREQPGVYEPVTIGCDSWIGERAIIAASIGKHCIIGAGSVVLAPVPDDCIAVGAPARVIRNRRHLESPTPAGRNKRCEVPAQLFTAGPVLPFR
jgi:virginiamycin A acetyltransferase